MRGSSPADTHAHIALIKLAHKKIKRSRGELTIALNCLLLLSFSKQEEHDINESNKWLTVLFCITVEGKIELNNLC